MTINFTKPAYQNLVYIAGQTMMLPQHIWSTVSNKKTWTDPKPVGTGAWTVSKNYVRDRNPIWVEAICAEGSQHVRIEGKSFMLSAEGELMPAKKGQEPPSLRHFDQSKK